MLRHASASQLVITIDGSASDVRLTVDDDGIGPPTRAYLAAQERGGHVGLVGMRERLVALGGRMNIEASPLGGTRLSVVLSALPASSAVAS